MRQKGFTPILIVLILSLVGIMGAYYYGLKKNTGVRPQTTFLPTSRPSQNTTPITTSFDPSTKWTTFVNSTYKYSLSAPSDFNVDVCALCNPPEIDMNLENGNNTISVGVSYGSQGTLTGNAGPNEFTPTNLLNIVIEGKNYEAEEYYDNIYKYYVFDINNLENDNFDQLRIGGQFSKVEDAKLVSEIASSLKPIK